MSKSIVSYKLQKKVHINCIKIDTPIYIILDYDPCNASMLHFTKLILKLI